MSHERLCAYLNLSPQSWPPDHYTLLGLAWGEKDRQRIEQHAQERMERLRSYQLTDAEQVTEAMNRLAQALVCLTDPDAKRAYDATRRPRPAAATAATRPRRRDQTPPAPAGPARDEDEAVAREPAPRRRPWLAVAWILWLSVGLVGVVAGAINYPAIKASFEGTTEETRRPVKAEPTRQGPGPGPKKAPAGPPPAPKRS